MIIGGRPTVVGDHPFGNRTRRLGKIVEKSPVALAHREHQSADLALAIGERSPHRLVVADAGAEEAVLVHAGDRPAGRIGALLNDRYDARRRSEERRVGKEWCITFRTVWSPF